VGSRGELGVSRAIGGAFVSFGTSFYNPCTGGVTIPNLLRLVVNTLAGGTGGFLGGYFATTSTFAGSMGGLGSSFLSSLTNYRLNLM